MPAIAAGLLLAVTLGVVAYLRPEPRRGHRRRPLLSIRQVERANVYGEGRLEAPTAAQPLPSATAGVALDRAIASRTLVTRAVVGRDQLPA